MNFRRGFALLEVVLVVGLVGAIAGVGVPLYRDYQIRNDLNLATEQVAQGLARARLLSQAAQDDGSWGFYVPAGILYRGESYETRDPAFDETYPMPSTITPRGLFDVNYGKVSGVPDETGEITLMTLNDYEKSILIEVRTESIAVVTGDRFTICHNPGPGQNTLSIPDNAWPGHQAHGDAFGECVGASSSSSSRSSSSSSSSSSAAPVPSSSSSSRSSSSSSSVASACQDRVQIDGDGTIKILGPLSVTFYSYGAEFGYGDGGPDVPVYVAYRKKDSGSWTNLFSGNQINTGGASQTVTGFSTSNNQNRLYLRFRAYFSQRGWLTYENYAYSDEQPSVLYLRDGDTPPTITADNGQQSISELIEPLVDETGVIDIGAHDVLMMADFNRESCNNCSGPYCSNCTGVDYQDGVVLVRFNTPSC